MDSTDNKIQVKIVKELVARAIVLVERAFSLQEVFPGSVPGILYGPSITGKSSFWEQFQEWPLNTSMCVHPQK